MSDISKQILQAIDNDNWMTAIEVAKHFNIDKQKASNSLYYLFRHSLAQKRKRTEVCPYTGKYLMEYRKRPSNLFNPDEFADYYRDPIKRGMSVYRHKDLQHL